jgi:nucleoside-diphosphate-sugar epimerase
MRVFVAGATGAVGKQLVPALLAAGHEVTGTTRSRSKAAELDALGAKGLVVDALDREAVMEAVLASRPEAVVHQLTAIPPSPDFRTFDQAFAQTNRLRTEGLDHLLAAALRARAKCIVAQSFTGWPNERQGTELKSESSPLDANPAPALRSTLEGIRYVEDTIARQSALRAIALRYGFLYGPGTSISAQGEVCAAIRARKFPLVGNAAGIWSFLHIRDAAAAVVVALERGEPGVYNIVDNEPAAVREWLPYLAQVLGAKPPMRVPAFVARLLIGKAGVLMMTDVRGSSNAKARRILQWNPAYPSWRQGFAEGLGGG